MSAPIPNSTVSHRIRMIRNRVRNPIDKIDPAAVPDDRSSRVANPGLAPKTRSSRKRSSRRLRYMSLASFPSPDRRQPPSLPHVARKGRSRDDLDLMPGLACDRLYIRNKLLALGSDRNDRRLHPEFMQKSCHAGCNVKVSRGSRPSSVRLKAKNETTRCNGSVSHDPYDQKHSDKVY